MKVELVRVETTDGMALDGALSCSDFDASSGDSDSISGPPALPFDAVILLHGVGSNFYQPRLLRNLAAAFDSSKCWTLRANTRGHDTIHTVATSQGARRQGAALERVSECVHDIDAWVGLLKERGRQSILLLGHSLGAIKAVYWSATARVSEHPVSGLAALSPPRLSASAFSASADAPRFLKSLKRAQTEVAAGREDQLIDVTFPFPMPISAGTYVDKYGGERYDILDHVADLTLPTLFTYGERELDHGPFQGLPEMIQRRRDQADAQVAVLEGADHSYADCEDAVMTAVAKRFSA